MNAHVVDVVNAIKQLQSTEPVAFQLRIFHCGDEYPKPMFVINHVHGAVRDKDGVGSAEALFHPAREVHPLLDEHHRVGTGLLCGLHQFKDVGDIVIGALVHFLVEPGQVLCGVGGLHAQRSPELILTERVGIGALSGIIGALVLVELTQTCGWRAVEPAV